MFHQVEADIYIMVDGDGTYPAAAVHELIAPILNRDADMVDGSRLHHQARSEFRLLNRFGNRLYQMVLNWLFHVRLTDILSGYRAFSRRLVKDLPLFAGGFEIETEMTIKTLQRGYRIVEVPVQDGVLIFHTILALFRDYKPLTFFGAVGLALVIAGFIPGTVVILDFLKTGLVVRLPSAVLAVGLVLCGVLLIVAGLIVHTIVRRFQELDHQLRLLATQLSQDRAGWNHGVAPADSVGAGSLVVGNPDGARDESTVSAG
jgi:hypothetical protein